MRAVAGRLGYCALDRTRAVLQGDEIRACWQAPARREVFEGGMFGDLADEPLEADATRAHAGLAAPGDAARVDGAHGPVADTRSWAIAVARGPRLIGPMGPSGLREATHVPARSIDARSTPVTAGESASADAELRDVTQLPAVRERDQDRRQAVADDRVLDDPEA